MMEKKLSFYKKKNTHLNTTKRKMFLYSLYCIARKEEFQFMTKTVLKRTSNATFNMKKVDLDES